MEAELDAVSSSFARLHGRGPEIPLDLFGRTMGPPPGSSQRMPDPHRRRLSAQRPGKHKCGPCACIHACYAWCHP